MTMLRRAITVPLATALMIGVLTVWPVLLVVGGVVGLISRSSLPVRTLGVVMAYALLELRALWQLIRGGQDRDEFIRDLLERTHTVGRRTLNVDVRVDEASPTPEQIPREEPVIVISRHCGPGDTLLVAWLLNIHYRLQLRIVLKAVLRCEPVLDFAGDLGCLCFLGHRGAKARKQIHDVATLLHGGEALLLFPEGGTSPGRGGKLRFSGSARRGGSAKPAVPGDRRIRCHLARAGQRPRCPEPPTQLSSCSHTRVSHRMDGIEPGGACPCTDGCWFVQFWFPPLSVPRLIK